MNEKDILRYFDHSLIECQDHIKAIRTIWEANHARYMCSKNWDKKKAWQAKIYTPIAKPKVKRAVNLIKTTLLRFGEYFDFDSPNRAIADQLYQIDKIRCNYTKRLVKAHLDSRPCSFISNFCESLEAAFGWSGIMILKFWVGYAETGRFDMPRNEYVKKKHLALRSKAIDPFLFDFTPDKRIQIEHQYITLPELWDAVDSGDFDKKTVNKLIEGDYGDPKNMKEDDKKRLQRLNLGETKNEYRKEIRLSHFWGPLIDKKNKVIKQHCHFTVANEKFLLTEVEDNPYPDKSTPYVFDSIIKVPFRHIGKALCEDVNQIEDGIVDLVCMQWDNALWQSLGITEVDQMMLTGQDKVKLGDLYPGMPILRKPGSPQMAFTRHEMGSDPLKIMPFLQELKQFHDSDHGVTEAISGNLPSEDTGGHPEARGDALSQFEGFATDLERGFFTRCIDKARDLILQFMSEPESDPNAVRIIGEMGGDIDGLTDEEKKSLIVDEYAIVPRGISIFFERNRKFNAYTGIYKGLNSLPEEGQSWIKWDRFIPRFFEAVAIDAPEDIVRSQEEMDQRAQMEQQKEQEGMQFEMQKIMAPLETKMQQMQMGVQERMQTSQIEIQADMQQEMAKLQAKQAESDKRLQSDMMKLQSRAQSDMAKMQAQFRTEQMKLAAQAQTEQMRMAAQAQSDQIKIAAQARADQSKQMIDFLKLIIDAAHKGEDRDVNLIDIAAKAEAAIRKEDAATRKADKTTDTE